MLKKLLQKLGLIEPQRPEPSWFADLELNLDLVQRLIGKQKEAAATGQMSYICVDLIGLLYTDLRRSGRCCCWNHNSVRAIAYSMVHPWLLNYQISDDGNWECSGEKMTRIDFLRKLEAYYASKA